jgi:ADP-heptose:LPS heptosyltransferase
MARARTIKKVLVIAGGSLSEFTPALAAMRRIRAVHEGADITLLTTPPFEALGRAAPYVDHVDIEGAPEEFGDWRALVASVRAAKYDRVYDMETSAWSNRLFHLLRPFPPQWSGVAAGCALPHRNPRRREMHPLERHADQLKAAGVWPDAPTEPGAAPPPDASWVMRRTLEPRKPARPHILLVPGEVADPPESRWRPNAYGELAHALRLQGYDLIILGGPDDAPLAQAIQRSAQARDLTGRTDHAQIAALAARADLAIGAATGRMHLVAAAGAPTLILSAKDIDPHRFGPRGHVAALYAETLEDLSVEEVLRAADRLISPIQKTM